MIRLPFVSRDRFDDTQREAALWRAIYEQERDRRDALLEKYQALANTIAELRRDGFQAKAPAPQRAERSPVPGTPDLDEIGQEGAKQEMIDQLAKDFARNGISDHEARAEAERIVKMAGGLFE